MGNRIAIVGMSVVCPGASDLSQFWQNLAAGVDSIIDAPPNVIEPLFFEDGSPSRADRFYCRRGGFLTPTALDPLRYGILPVAAEGADPDQLLSLSLCEAALHDAGVLEKGISLERASIILGRGNFAGMPQLRASSIVRTAEEFVALLRHALPDRPESDWELVRADYQKAYGRYQGDTVTATMPNLVAAMVANHFDMHGPAYTLDAACASSVVALDQAMYLLTTGQSDLVLVGGMHSGQSSVFWSAFNLMGAMSHRGVIAPFSEDADGLLIGQGAGYIVVKTLQRALADNDRIYAVVEGTAVGSDGGGHSVLVTNPAGQVRVVEAAWRAAGRDPAEVAYVEAHGTATQVGDASEIETLTRVFGDRSARPAYLGSVKSNIGHLMPAAGIVGLIKTALALYHRQIPPTLHAERPMKVLEESRFRLPQTLIDWRESGLPLVAGVDAFGFGGVDAHAVLTAYEEPPEQARRYRADRRRQTYGQAYAVGAPTREGVLQKLDIHVVKNQIGRLIGEPGDPCRLVVFNPTEERFALAAEIVRRGEPWYGRSDIWYTEKPLLAEGGKIVFLFAGYGTVTESESLVDALDLTRLQFPVDPDSPGAGIADHFVASMLAHDALLATGITPDFYGGHSTGEWHAARASGMLGDDFDTGYISFNLDHPTEDGELPEFRQVAATGQMDDSVTAAVLAANPTVALVDDNCPGQRVFCAPVDDVDGLTRALDAQHVVSHVMPYSSALHSPYMEPVLGVLMDALTTVPVHEGRAPLWSAITLDELKADGRTAAELFGPQLSRPVLFRQAVEKLYDMGCRVFIQVGFGSLTGFVDATLAGQEFATASTMSPLRDAADQLRRVHALTFVLGGPADLTFMGVAPMLQDSKSIFLTPTGATIITELPALDTVLAALPATPAMVVPASAPAVPASVPPPVSVSPPPPRNRLGLPPRGFTRTESVPQPGPILPPVLSAGEVLAPQPTPTPAPAVAPVAPAAPVPAAAPPVTRPKRAGSSFEEPIRWSVDDMPYVMDHSIVNQPVNWPHREDVHPIMPLTLTIELLAEIVAARVPDLKVVKLGPITATEFIEINEPFEATLRGFWKSESTVSLTVPGHLMMDVTVAADYPEPPGPDYVEQVDADIGPAAREVLSREDMYVLYSFHRPRYWSTVRATLFGVNGFIGEVQKAEGKGSLLDQAGGSIGLFPHLYMADNRVTFPVRVQSVTFYQDMADQAGLFEYHTVIRRVTDTFITGDVVFTRAGRIWAIARDWTNQRVGMDISLWDSITKPQHTLLSQPIAPGVFFYELKNPNKASAAFLVVRYLARDEKPRVLDNLDNLPAQEDYLVGRIALKDAVRARLQADNGAYLYPIEIRTVYDSNGKPQVRQDDGSPFNPPIEVSLAHRDNRAVAIASDQPVGIDLERIEAKDAGFMDLAFTDAEKALIAAQDDPVEWAIRFWVAKEAYSKMVGTGLGGTPKQFAVERVEADSLFVRGVEVNSRKLQDKYIIGWTTGAAHDKH